MVIRKAGIPVTKVVALLDVMWDWRMKTSMANPNYLAEAPRCFRINPENKSGKMLYKLIGHSDLLVTNTCPQLVKSARDKGKPETDWTRENLLLLYPFELLLVCGRIAQSTYDQIRNLNLEYRTIYMPHPAARTWSKRDIQFASKIIRQGTHDLWLDFCDGRLRASALPPF